MNGNSNPVEDSQEQVGDQPQEAQAPVEDSAGDEAPAQEAPAESVPATPLASPPPTLAEIIADGAAQIQDGLQGRRDNKTAIEDTRHALVAAQAQADRAVKRDGEWDVWLGTRIDDQIANLQNLKTTLAL